MATITIKKLHKLAGRRDLESDLKICCYDYGLLTPVRYAERSKESRYPNHAIMRRVAQSYFGRRGYHVYPHGIGSKGARACADMALIPKGAPDGGRPRIVFVECLSAHFVDRETIKKKTELAESGALFFVIEDRPKREFDRARDWERFVRRVRRLAASYPTYWCRVGGMNGFMRRARGAISTSSSPAASHT